MKNFCKSSNFYPKLEVLHVLTATMNYLAHKLVGCSCTDTSGTNTTRSFAFDMISFHLGLNSKLSRLTRRRANTYVRKIFDCFTIHLIVDNQTCIILQLIWLSKVKWRLFYNRIGCLWQFNFDSFIISLKWLVENQTFIVLRTSIWLSIVQS